MEPQSFVMIKSDARTRSHNAHIEFVPTPSPRRKAARYHRNVGSQGMKGVLESTRFSDLTFYSGVELEKQTKSR